MPKPRLTVVVPTLNKRPQPLSLFSRPQLDIRYQRLDKAGQRLVMHMFKALERDKHIAAVAMWAIVSMIA